MDNNPERFKALIFLDFDGVLNTDSFRDTYGFGLNPYLVNNLIRLAREGSFGIVLSTAWRNIGMKDIRSMFTCSRFASPPLETDVDDLMDRIVGITESFIVRSLTDAELRSLEISSYVNDHEVERWFALDDLDLVNNKMGIPAERFVRTNPADGLTDKLVQEILDGKLRLTI